MPVRFTCRLVVVATDGGKFRVRYGCLIDPHMQMLTVHGPRMVIPPPEDMTPEELHRWQHDLVTGTEFYYSIDPTALLHASLVEAVRTIEDEIPRGAVTAELCCLRNHAGDQTLGVHVTNEWERRIPNFSLSTDCHPDAPQPLQLGAVEALSLGGSESMFHPVLGTTPAILWPGTSVDFWLEPEALKVLRSRVASVSVERYWIALRTDGYEFDRISGEKVGAFVEQKLA